MIILRYGIFLIGVVLGASGMVALNSAKHPVWSYAFWYSYNDQKAIAVRPDGKIEFGPAYAANTLQQLLDALKQMRNGDNLADCHETGYRFPLGDTAVNGIIRIYPGTAPPFPPPRILNNL